MLAGNIAVWSTIMWMMVHRMYSAVGMGRLGASVEVDLYDLPRLKPFARMAVRDILVVMGAVALMPIQKR